MRRLSLVLFLIAAMAISASATWRFTDVTTPDMMWPPSTAPHPGPYASCVAWGDLNNDGLPDLFVGSAQGANCKLYVNNGGGSFTDATEDWNLQTLANVRSAQFVDYDQDGLLDLFCITDNPIPAELYGQDENRRMRPVNLGINEEDALAVQSAVWNDFNHDGQLDLIINGLGARDPEMTALVPSGTGFTPARDGEFPAGIRHVSRISLIDFDHDGDLDILAGSERNNSQFYVNNRGRYVDMLDDYGLEPDVAANGVAWGDFNNDTYLDFVTCGTAEQTYMYMGCVEDGAIGFHEVFHELNNTPYERPDWLPYIENATSVQAGDFNMDGWTDLFFVRGDYGNFLLLNNEGERWSNSRELEGLLCMPQEETQAAAWADMDGDGDLDLALAMHDQGIKLMRNDLVNEREYLTIKIADYFTDTPALNCQIFVKFEEGSQWATTSMANSSVGFDNMSYLFVNPTLNHSRELSIGVVWPSGAASYYGIDDVALWGTTTLRPPTVTTHPDTEPDPVVVDPLLAVGLNISPNPFNPSTSVKYTVPEAGQVSLSVYNLLGQEVASLVSGYMEAGVHTVTFDASALPSGLYLARLTTAGQTQLHRMVLTK